MEGAKARDYRASPGTARSVQILGAGDENKVGTGRAHLVFVSSRICPDRDLHHSEGIVCLFDPCRGNSAGLVWGREAADAPLELITESELSPLCASSFPGAVMKGSVREPCRVEARASFFRAGSAYRNCTACWQRWIARARSMVRSVFLSQLMLREDQAPKQHKLVGLCVGRSLENTEMGQWWEGQEEHRASRSECWHKRISESDSSGSQLKKRQCGLKEKWKVAAVAFGDVLRKEWRIRQSPQNWR